MENNDINEWAYKYPFWFGKRTLPDWMDELLEYLPSLGAKTSKEQKELLSALYSIIQEDIYEDETISEQEVLIRTNLVSVVRRALDLIVDLHHAGKLNVEE